MLPDYIIASHKNVPSDRPVSVLMRHSARYPINSIDEVWTAGLTPEGIEMARSYGNWLAEKFNVVKIETSPIVRCQDTGKFIAKEIGDNISVEPVDVLAHPNENAEYDSLADYLERKSWPDRINDIAAYLVPNGHHDVGLNIFISHDTVLVAMAAYWLNLDVRSGDDWPRFMEPFLMWWERDQLIAAFRGETYEVKKILDAHLPQRFSAKPKFSSD